MKKLVFLAAFIFSFNLANAQLGEGTRWLKAGVNFGLPVGDAADVSSFVLGLDLKYQFLDAESFAVGVSTGYSHYFGKEENGFEYSDAGIIPAALLLRYYPTKNFFLGGDVGYGFFTEGDETGGFYYRPEIGYHNLRWNIYAFYQGVSSDGISPAAVGIGINYNIIQGR